MGYHSMDQTKQVEQHKSQDKIFKYLLTYDVPSNGENASVRNQTLIVQIAVSSLTDCAVPALIYKMDIII